MLYIADLRKLLPDGKYTMDVTFNSVRVLDSSLNEVYLLVDERNCHDVNKSQIFYHTLNGYQFATDDILPISVHMYKYDGIHTICLENDKLTITDGYGRTVFSLRPDDFHYEFIYWSISNSFPSMEWDSDGVMREFTEMDTECLCYESSSNYDEPIERDIPFAYLLS